MVSGERVAHTPHGLKSSGFLCLSSVCERWRTAAWLRLSISRSGGGKAQRRRIHTRIRLLGGARPVTRSMPLAKGYMAHNLRSASWEQATPASFEAQSWGTFPPGWRLSLMLFSILRHFLNPWTGYPWLRTANSFEHLDQRGSVFTQHPSCWNPYAIEFFKVLHISSHTGGAKWKCTRGNG